ncbi:MAG TPA: glycoside hydrolase family 65 protein, partial [Thermococcus sp.]|nr:glycoside hydrolase family 65 protein [Thermococcus sp.]
VIATQYLLKDQFDIETIKKNFDYYIVRTTHASSLSMPAYSIVASWLGYEDLAYEYFMKCAYIELKNLYGNTHDGFHLATAGGVWQVLFRGFCGIDIEENSIKIAPRLPSKWKAVKFGFSFRGTWLEIKITPKEVAVRSAGGKEAIRLNIVGEELFLGPNEQIIVSL